MPVLIWDKQKEQISLQQYCNYVEDKFGSILNIVTVDYATELPVNGVSINTAVSVAIIYTEKQ